MPTQKIKHITISCLAVSVFLSLAYAQNPIVGIWQTSFPLGQGLPDAQGIFTANADGSYREEMNIQGQVAAFWEGTYTLSPDGTLVQTEIRKSPQICVQTQCVANEGPATTTSKVSFQSPNTFTVTIQDPGTGQTNSLNWQRVQGSATPTPGQPLGTPTTQPLPTSPGTGGPIPPAPGQSGQLPTLPGQTGQLPAAPNPIGGSPAAPNPLGAQAQNSWAGVYSDGQLSLLLQEGVAGVVGLLELDGTQYPLQVQGDAMRLEGTFQSGNDRFPVVLNRTVNGITVLTGGATYELLPENTAPVNPLGN